MALSLCRELTASLLLLQFGLHRSNQEKVAMTFNARALKPLGKLVCLGSLLVSVGISLPGSAAFAAAAATGTISMSWPITYVEQNSGVRLIAVNRRGGSSGAASVRCSTANGTAIAGRDYTAIDRVITWTSGDGADKACNVTISNATPFTGSRTLYVNLTDATGAPLGPHPQSVLTIYGDKGAGLVSLSASTYSATQRSGSVTITVNRTSGDSGGAAVSYATANGTAMAGTNYTAVHGSLSWGNNDMAPKSFVIPISTAASFTGTKTIAVALAGAEGASLGSTKSAIVTINGSALVTATNSDDACMPMTISAPETLLQYQKKVFAHYFYPLPLSIDNRASSDDYYNTQYLTKSGENNKWVAQGGYLRSRPLGVPTSSDPNWKLLNMEREVTLAMSRGITGFTFDVMSVDQATDATSQLHQMLTAAQAVNSQFKIIVMPDMTTLGTDADAVIQIIASVAKSPAAYRLTDGRLVVSPFDAEVNPASWWQSVLSQLKSQGIDVAFVPTFFSWKQYASSFASLSYGFADWGGATPGSGSGIEGDAAFASSSYGKIFMSPIDGQQFRPKDYLYWEAGNSAAFRGGWEAAISGDSEWAQLVTWNDFSETSQVEPYTDATLNRSIGTGFYNLNGYYSQWFLSGHQPVITHDVLYYFYRKEATTAAGPGQSKTDHISTGNPENDIEVVAFLTAPGTLEITIGGHTYTQNVIAGESSFKIPTQAGTPVFTLTRAGADVFSFQGGVQIYGSAGLPSGIVDLTYWSGSASKTGICSL
jgi:Glycosyl hydrolase family 71/Calx-beta domain